VSRETTERSVPVRLQCGRCGYEVVGGPDDPPLDECPVCGRERPFSDASGERTIERALARGARLCP
jgi:rubrerythrin